MKHFIGIDIGKDGGIVILNEENEVVFKGITPKIKGTSVVDIKEMRDLLQSYSNSSSVIVGFEDLHALYGSSSGATFNFGFINGVTETIVVCLELPYIKVRAKEWQSFCFKGIQEIRKPDTYNTKTNKTVKGRIDTKAMALQSVKRLYPKVDLRPTERSRNFHDGLVDALLIAFWLRNNYK